MSNRNGDKARHNRDRRKRILQRTKSRALREQLGLRKQQPARAA